MPVARDQLIFAFLGLILYFFASFTDFKILRPFSFYIYAFNIILLIMTLGFGIYSKGAIRWIPLGIREFTLQPSEFMKLSLIIFLSSFLSYRFRSGSLKDFFLSLFTVLLPATLIFVQPDFGTAFIVILIWLLLSFIARLNLSSFIVLLLAILVISPLFFLSLKPYQKERIQTFLSPSLDPLGAGYHVIQSEIAVGSGRVLGRGFGRGTQSHLRFLPEYHTDFIFASLSEEWGFLGSLVVIILFGLILARSTVIALKSQSLFGQLLCLGIMVMIFSQATINIGMNLGLAPITGIPLPLLSSGGSSLVLTMVSLGFVQSVARNSKRV
jgi:rod shape determining protein RodA